MKIININEYLNKCDIYYQAEVNRQYNVKNDVEKSIILVNLLFQKEEIKQNWFKIIEKTIEKCNFPPDGEENIIVQKEILEEGVKLFPDFDILNIDIDKKIIYITPKLFF